MNQEARSQLETLPIGYVTNVAGHVVKRYDDGFEITRRDPQFPYSTAMSDKHVRVDANVYSKDRAIEVLGI